MARYVSVRYVVPVYCTVDLDADPNRTAIGTPCYPDSAVVRVYEDDESITRLDDRDRMAALMTDGMATGGVLDTSYESDRSGGGDGEDVNPDALTAEERERALEIAEHTMWPAWERG